MMVDWLLYADCRMIGPSVVVGDTVLEVKGIHVPLQAVKSHRMIWNSRYTITRTWFIMVLFSCAFLRGLIKVFLLFGWCISSSTVERNGFPDSSYGKHRMIHEDCFCFDFYGRFVNERICSYNQTNSMTFGPQIYSGFIGIPIRPDLALGRFTQWPVCDIRVWGSYSTKCCSWRSSWFWSGGVPNIGVKTSTLSAGRYGKLPRKHQTDHGLGVRRTAADHIDWVVVWCCMLPPAVSRYAMDMGGTWCELLRSHM